MGTAFSPSLGVPTRARTASCGLRCPRPFSGVAGGRVALPTHTTNRRAQRLQNGPSMNVVVSEPRVFEEGPVEGEHGFQKTVMEIDIDGKTLRLESGEIGRLAAGSVVARQGDSVVYTSACGDLDTSKEEVIEDFVPMSVHYQERSSAAGKTSGGYIKRDGRPSDEEVLVSRIIDRTLRPLFPVGFCREVQILSWVLSYDQAANVDPIALVSASAALLSSAIPFDTPVAGVAVGMDGGKFVVNPPRETLRGSRLNLFVSGTEESVMMIEGAADFLTEEEMAEAIEMGMKAVSALCRGLKAFAAKVREVRGISSKLELVRSPDASLYAEFEDKLADMMDAAMKTGKTGKFDVYGSVFDVERAAKKLFLDEDSDAGRELDVKATFKRFAAEKMRLLAKESDLRIDGRSTKQVRPISVNMRPLPAAAVHGSALFSRGDTQTLATVTLGDKGSRQRLETLDGEDSKRFYLQYTFPPSCNGEVGRIGAIGRREIGHGNLAERALAPVIPTEADFPYTIRVESLVTESCGSSSMASVCSGSLALFDAGVPVKRAIAGVAMGLLMPDNLKRGTDGDVAAEIDEEAVILTDILGLEDGFGTMDFKVAGDAKGITAFQLDIKCEGLSINLLKRALNQAKEGRLHMLYHMLRAKKEPTEVLAPSVPKMVTMTIPQSAIGKVIGPGGAMIRSLIEDFGLLNIDIDESGAEGLVTITSLDPAKNAKAEEKIRFLVQEANNFSPSGSSTLNKRVPDPEVGKIYKECAIVGVHPFGCFVELYSGKEGLVHVSELDGKRIANVADKFKVGDKMDVKVLALKDQKGKIRLSRKAAMTEAAAQTDPAEAGYVPASPDNVAESSGNVTPPTDSLGSRELRCREGCAVWMPSVAAFRLGVL
eukprot:CAMPEP_0202853120 /NCGR_PEP_ID=MMETSP1389-20130828/90317_1 /ASSEMBLY_ACC=CAM_ASM_000865 /TAXON_ID=302021 /ORGANISM="Rhodomonas sp., Strain CCMP768" /LENGTH=881 /DNA_ID=CAMNT_0049531659 /DNA_START=232 /DNA_END=2878 /DNA_ORIENTATION=-